MRGWGLFGIVHWELDGTLELGRTGVRLFVRVVFVGVYWEGCVIQRGTHAGWCVAASGVGVIWLLRQQPLDV